MYTAKRGYRPGDEPVAGYHLTKFLGRGQFGEVWQAKAPGGMQVALKIIDLAEREGLKEFSGLLRVKDIRHANLVEFVACWVKTEDGQVLDELPADPIAALSPRDSSIEIGGTMLFDAAAASPTRPVELIVAMSLGSKTLFRRLQEINHAKDQKDWTGIPDGELLEYMEQAAKGIDYLNQQGIIHGDIKPHNLLIVGDSVKVCDFGLARAVSNLRMTQSGMGTVAYAAPELFEGKPHIQSDQYCLTISYIELRTGALPFDEPNPYQVIELHRKGRLDFQRLSSRERSVVKRATEIKPERRWTSCTEMVRKLRESREQERVGASGGVFSFLRRKAPPAERMPAGEESIAGEAADRGLDSGITSKPELGRAKPSPPEPSKPEPTKKESGRKKSGPQSPAAARAVRTHRRRGDDTDAIAATVASESLRELPPRRPSTIGLAVKIAGAVCVMGALVGGYMFVPSGTVKEVYDRVFKRPPPVPVTDGDLLGRKADVKDDSRKDAKPTPPGPSPLETVTRDYHDAVAKGGFAKAAELVAKAKNQLVYADYEQLEKAVRNQWGEPATNPILRQLNEGEIAAGEAALRLKDADAEDSFVKLVGPVPAGVWQAVLEKWTTDFEARVAGGEFKEAAAVVTNAKQVLVAERYEQLCTAIRKGWSEPSTNPILQQLRAGKTAVRHAVLRLRDADAEESFVKLVGRIPAGVWQAVLETWMKDFDQLLPNDLEKAVEEWKAVNKWQDAPSELMSPADKSALRGRIQKEWKRKGFDVALARDDFRLAKDELVKPLASELFDGAELDGIRTEVRPKWKGRFENLLKATEPEALAKAFEELKDVGKVIDFPQEYSQKVTQVREAFSTGIHGLTRDAQWAAAKKLLDGAPEELFPKDEREKKLARIQTGWNDAFEALAKTDLDAAGKMLDAVVPIKLLTEQDIEKNRRMLGEGEQKKWMAAFAESFSKLLAAGKFPEAKLKLDEAVAQKRIASAEAQAKEKDLRRPWLAWIRANWDKSDQADRFQSQLAEFLKASPEPSEANEARLLRARALVRLGLQTGTSRELNDAGTDLRDLEKAADLPADRAYLRDVLLVLAGLRQSADLVPPREKPAPPWELDRWEQETLGKMQSRMNAAEIEKKVAPITSALAQRNYEESARLFKQSFPEPSQVPEVKYLAALIALRQPEPKAESARELLGVVEYRYPPAAPDGWPVDDVDDVVLVTREVPFGLAKLGGPAAYAGQAKELERAAAWLRAARKKFPSYKEISASLYAVATRRIGLRVSEPQAPSKEDWNQLREWDESRTDPGAGIAAGPDGLLAEAWRVECMLALGEQPASARDRLGPIREKLLKAQPAYGRYLWCRALRALPDPAWDDIVRELNDLVPALQGPDPMLAAQDRARAVAGLIAEAAQKRRQQARPWKSLGQIPFNPFAGQAEQHASLLKAAVKLVDPRQRADLELSLALAAFHQPKPEFELVWSLTRELPRGRNADVQADLLPLLLAEASSFWQQPPLAKLPADNPQFTAAVRATTQLLQELSKDEAGKITKEGAAAFSKSVLEPLLDNPDLKAKAAASSQAGSELLSELSGAVAKFLDNQKDAQWPPLAKGMPSVYHVIESQAGLAIDLAPKVKPDSAKLAGYYATRASARSNKPDLDVAKVLADAESALKHQPGLRAALGVQAYALFRRAGERPKRDQILKDLSDAIAAGKQAVENCPQNDKGYPIYLLTLSNAHLTLGNYETDPQTKQDHFNQARAHASTAAKLKHEYGDEARLLLGNVYEDLASQVGEDPKQNYLEAKKQFSEVLERNPFSAKAKSCLARCFFKALSRPPRLSPQDLGLRGDRDAALKKCRDDLEMAIAYSGQDAIRIEGHYFAGLIYKEQGEWAKADENLGKAADLAKQLGASSQATCVHEWAKLPVDHANHLLETRPAEDPDVLKLFAEAERRAQQLQAIPPGAFIVPAKQAAVTLGSIRRSRKEYDEAVKAYDQALPDPAEASALDVPLLLARADCNLRRSLAKNYDAALAEEARRDASRALELASAPGTRADAHYFVASAHYFLSRQPGDAAEQHREGFLKNMREAVRLAPQGKSALIYRDDGATFAANVAMAIRETDKQQAVALLQQAQQWLQESLELTQDPENKKAISGKLEFIKKAIGILQGQP